MSDIRLNVPSARSRSRARALAVAVLIGAGAVAGCSGAPTPTPITASPAPTEVLQPGRPGEPNATLSGSAAAPVVTPSASDPDANFFTDMIAHHAQAVLMVDSALANLTDPQTRAIASRIGDEQKPEISAMATWLTSHGRSAPPEATNPGLSKAEHHSGMPGMASAADLERLAAARGVAADRLFLTLMIAHHQGALSMVGEHAPHGSDPDVERMAAEINVTQSKQIAQMQGFLARLPSP